MVVGSRTQEASRFSHPKRNFFLKRFALCTLVLSLVLSACGPSKKPKKLHVEILHSATMLTPIETQNYSERSTTFTVTVSGFKNKTDANSLSMSFAPQPGITPEVLEDPATENTRTFVVSLRYDGKQTFSEGSATIRFSLNTPKGYKYANGTPSTHVAVRDGQAKNRPIPVNKDNIGHFNQFARTDGLNRHYQLVENIALSTTENESNWTAIGRHLPNVDENPFVGSFDGAHHSISNLKMVSDNNLQGMFGVLGEGAVVENLGLRNVSIRVIGTGDDKNGKNGTAVGGLVGANDGGLVQNCYVTGSVAATQMVGSLVGYNIKGTVQNSYAKSSVTGNALQAGGLIGYNEGTVQNCYSTGNVEGLGFVGGLIGLNRGKVQNCYATGSVSGSHFAIGGLVGTNTQETNTAGVQNCVALNPSVVSNDNGSAGRVVGSNAGFLSNNYARSMMIRHNTTNSLRDKEALDSTLGGVDGAPVSFELYGNSPFWTQTNPHWNSDSPWDFVNVWQWNDTLQLPILRNINVEVQTATTP